MGQIKANLKLHLVSTFQVKGKVNKFCGWPQVMDQPGASMNISFHSLRIQVCGRRCLLGLDACGTTDFQSLTDCSGCHGVGNQHHYQWRWLVHPLVVKTSITNWYENGLHTVTTLHCIIHVRLIEIFILQGEKNIFGISSEIGYGTRDL